MPHGWRSRAQSRALPGACTTEPPATPAAIPGAIADALVDRTPIDWTALLGRTTDPRERASLNGLRRLDGLRHSARPVNLDASIRDPRLSLLRMLVALSAVYITCGLARAALAF